jgi:hypothetical protein
VDRKESGAPGDFASLSTEAEVLEAVRSELGEAAVDALQAAMAAAEARAEPAAEPEPVVEPRDPNATLN